MSKITSRILIFMWSFLVLTEISEIYNPTGEWEKSTSRVGNTAWQSGPFRLVII